jgi:hypothetical protein
MSLPSPLLDTALAGAQHVLPAPAAAPRSAIVLGAGGALGSAVLEHVLASGFATVHAVVTQALAQALAPAVRGLHPVTLPALQAGAAGVSPQTAFIVFDRQRHANGREIVFLAPDPADLTVYAQALRRAGVRDLVVVMPHAPALLPRALALGLASLDEQSVAALDFDHVAFVRSAQRAAVRAVGAPQRLAAWMLSQLRYMLPMPQQALRADKVAAFVAALARALPDDAPGTRVIPQEWVWQHAQPGGSDALLRRWLAGVDAPGDGGHR